MSPLSIAYLLMLSAFACFSVMDTSAKWLVNAAIPALQVAWLRYLGHFICNSVVYIPRQGLGIVRSQSPLLQSLRALCLLSATVLNFTALKYLPLTVTIAIFFVTPLAVCVLSVPFLGERVGIKRFSAVMVGFLGVLIIVQPWSAEFNPYIFLSLGSMLCAAGYFVVSRKAAGRDPNATTQFFIAGIATFCLGPFALYYWVWPEGWQMWLAVVTLGTLGMLGHSMVAWAHRLAEASVLAPTIYSQAVFIAILSWLVFGHAPEKNTILGTLIIIGSGLFVWYRERQITDTNGP